MASKHAPLSRLEPRLRWLGLTIAILLARAATADACQCDSSYEEGDAIASRPIVFDGWVIEAQGPWSCPLPPAPRPRVGCVRISVVRRQDCKPSGDLLTLVASDDTALSPTTIDDDAATFCGIKAGKYVLRGSPTWGGTDNGTLDYGRALAIVPGGSYVAFESGRVGQTLRVGVYRALKGQVAREVVVKTEADCGTPYLGTGESLRFFAERGNDGALVVHGCWSVRQLTEAERAEPVAAPAPAPDAGVAPPPTPAPPTPPPTPAPPTPRSGGCATAPAPGLAVILLVIIRRRRPRVTAPPPRPRPR